jgi:hypothetical protein
MANITIVIPDAQVQRALEAFANVYGWTPELGVTKAAFAKAQVAEFVKSTTLSYERQKAAAALVDTAIDVN